jgi:hypothetical protein
MNVLTKDEIKAAVIEALQDLSCDQTSQHRRCCDFCQISPQEHVEHHAAIKTAMSTKSAAIKGVWLMITLGGVGWIGTAIWDYIVKKVQGG